MGITLGVIAYCSFKIIPNTEQFLTLVKQIFVFACMKPAGKAFELSGKNFPENTRIKSDHREQFLQFCFTPVPAAARSKHLAVSPVAAQCPRAERGSSRVALPWLSRQCPQSV